MDGSRITFATIFVLEKIWCVFSWNACLGDFHSLNSISRPRFQASKHLFLKTKGGKEKEQTNDSANDFLDFKYLFCFFLKILFLWGWKIIFILNYVVGGSSGIGRKTASTWFTSRRCCEYRTVMLGRTTNETTKPP